MSDIRLTLVSSRRWQALTARLDIMAMAKAPRLQIESWSGRETADVLDWAAETDPWAPPPKVIADYVASVQRDGNVKAKALKFP